MTVVQRNPFWGLDTGYPDKHIVVTPEQFGRMMRFLGQSPRLIFDYETDGTDWFKGSRACGLALAGYGEGQLHSFYVPFRHRTGQRQLDTVQIGDGFKALLGNPDTEKGAHNAKFDDHFTRVEGWTVEGPLVDTMIAARLYDENRRLGLKYRAESDLGREDARVWDQRVEAQVAQRALDLRMGKTEYLAQYGYSQVDIGTGGTYACFDVEFTALLWEKYESAGLPTRYERVWRTEMDLVRVLCDAEEVGMRVDVDYLEQLRRTLRQERETRLEAIYQAVGRGVNPGSDDEVRRLLLGWGCELTKLTPSEADFAVDSEVLGAFAHAHPAIPQIVAWREVEKLLSTYTASILGRLDSRNILHPDYQQPGTNTGRMSCRNPNFQNQPSDDDERAVAYSGKGLEHGGVDPWSIRRAYVVTEPGWVRLYYDYSQIELRVLAYYSQDPIMVDAYLTGKDIHSVTAQEVYESKEKKYRRPAKVINFGLSYGMGPTGLATQANLSVEEAKVYLDKFYRKFAGVARFKQLFFESLYRSKGYFQNLFGRPRHVWGMDSPSGKVQGRAQRQAIASLIQGTAAELTKESMVRMDRRYKAEGLQAQIVATIHDEIQIDCPVHEVAQAGRIAKEEMENYPEFDPIPIVVDAEYTITSWADKRSV